MNLRTLSLAALTATSFAGSASAADVAGGNGSFETSSASTTNFIPLGGQDWCFSSANTKGCVEVDLSQFAGKNGVKIKFESVNANGNNMFIDNVEVLGNCYVIPLSVNEVSSGRNLQLYPNPATNELTLESSSTIIQYSIIDLTGKILHQENRLNSDLIQVRLDDLTSGVYVIQVQTADGKRSAHRFVLR